MPLLEVTNLRTHFHTRGGVVRAVDGVSFRLDPGETLGIVGESGSGKSVTCLSLLGLVAQPPGRVEATRATFDGIDLLHSPPATLRSLRGRRIAIVFQDPMAALNPYLRVSDQLIEPLRIHTDLSRRAARAQALQLLGEVGLADAARRMDRYPHEFSGGQRQRIMLAMALTAQPDLLIADEPTTALDVTVQAQILDLLRRLQQERNLAVIFITHDLGVVAGLCRRVQVMYAGRIVESAQTPALFREPRHPYTRALQQSIPALQPKGVALPTIPGLPPNLAQLPAGCAFAPRCQFATDACRTDPAPDLLEIQPDHHCACRRVQTGEI